MKYRKDELEDGQLIGEIFGFYDGKYSMNKVEFIDKILTTANLKELCYLIKFSIGYFVLVRELKGNKYFISSPASNGIYYDDEYISNNEIEMYKGKKDVNKKNVKIIIKNGVVFTFPYSTLFKSVSRLPGGSYLVGKKSKYFIGENRFYNSNFVEFKKGYKNTVKIIIENIASDIHIAISGGIDSLLLLVLLKKLNDNKKIIPLMVKTSTMNDKLAEEFCKELELEIIFYQNLENEHIYKKMYAPSNKNFYPTFENVDYLISGDFMDRSYGAYHTTYSQNYSRYKKVKNFLLIFKNQIPYMTYLAKLRLLLNQEKYIKKLYQLNKPYDISEIKFNYRQLSSKQIGAKIQQKYYMSDNKTVVINNYSEILGYRIIQPAVQGYLLNWSFRYFRGFSHILKFKNFTYKYFKELHGIKYDDIVKKYTIHKNEKINKDKLDFGRLDERRKNIKIFLQEVMR